MIDSVKSVLPQNLKQGVRNTIRYINSIGGRVKSIGKHKVFGIGLNKTGTTSLKAAMEELGYIVGRQRSAELLMHDWAMRDFSKIVKYCKTAQFFQDVPFSKPFTYIVLDHEFPESKFVLTIRDSAEQWYNSLTKFHAQKWGEDKRVPTKRDLQNASYIRKGWAWEINRFTYNTPEDDPYKKDDLIEYYNGYNRSVREYFKYRSNDLLVLNVAENGAYHKLCDFLGVEVNRDEFPWKNKTEEVKQ